MSNKGYGFKETSDIIERIQNYQEDHMVEHFASLGTRLDVVNQIVRDEGTSSNSIRLNKVKKQMDVLEDRYVNITNASSLEEKINVLSLVNDINKQIEKLEGKSGGKNGD